VWGKSRSRGGEFPVSCLQGVLRGGKVMGGKEESPCLRIEKTRLLDRKIGREDALAKKGIGLGRRGFYVWIEPRSAEVSKRPRGQKNAERKQVYKYSLPKNLRDNAVVWPGGSEETQKTGNRAEKKNTSSRREVKILP